MAIKAIVFDFFGVFVTSEGKNENMFELLKDLKDRYTTVLLSNVSPESAEELEESGYYRYFKIKIFPYETGMTKAFPEIWDYVLEKISYSSNEVLFVDDSETNIRVAEKKGIHSILYNDFESLKAELSNILNSDNVKQ